MPNEPITYVFGALLLAAVLAGARFTNWFNSFWKTFDARMEEKLGELRNEWQKSFSANRTEHREVIARMQEDLKELEERIRKQEVYSIKELATKEEVSTGFKLIRETFEHDRQVSAQDRQELKQLLIKALNGRTNS